MLFLNPERAVVEMKHIARPGLKLSPARDWNWDEYSERLEVDNGDLTFERGARIVVYTSEIMKWFRDDFEKWGGGEEAFLRRHLPREKAAQLAPSIALRYDDYDWTLNDWRR